MALMIWMYSVDMSQ